MMNFKSKAAMNSGPVDNRKIDSSFREMSKMLLPTHTDYLIYKQRCEDLIREAEQARLILAIAPSRTKWAIYRQLVGWMGTQMVNVGGKLQHYGAISSHKSV